MLVRLSVQLPVQELLMIYFLQWLLAGGCKNEIRNMNTVNYDKIKNKENSNFSVLYLNLDDEQPMIQLFDQVLFLKSKKQRQPADYISDSR